MQRSPFDNLPSLSQEEALQILNTPRSQLELESDYYKAVSHLVKYPGRRTEEALLGLLRKPVKDRALLIARRKAVDVLARLGCIRAMPIIGKCLQSSDPYLVENAAWALKELGCKEKKLHQKMISLLDDPKQNQRILIQVLASLGVKSSLSKINTFAENNSTSSLVRGASIAAISKLTGKLISAEELKNHLKDPNQNNRHCAVQDVIDSGQFDLLSAVLRTPVAPSFRIRALSDLWPDDLIQFHNSDLFSALDAIIRDDPEDLDSLHQYETKPSIEFLIDQLFSTDFSHCYWAFKTLKRRALRDTLPLILNCLGRAKRDYGAIYFLIHLFRSFYEIQINDFLEIQEFTFSALNDSWPHYMKFRPAAILTLSHFSLNNLIENIDTWVDPSKTPYWVSRYAALMAVDAQYSQGNALNFRKSILKCINDENRFVTAKATHILKKID